jgi:choline dehydrogenase-like flavoprotein
MPSLMDDSTLYDVVIVGAGISGAIVAYELTKKDKNVKVALIEAGVEVPAGREALMERYLLSTSKLPEAPYGENVNAPSAAIRDLLEPGNSYLDQAGSPIAFGSTYVRRAGGTGWHWMGTSLRFVPNDFKLLCRYGQGADWPISYDDLGITSRRPDGATYYELAEREIGVSANVADQPYSPYRQGYSYPNPGIPLSRVDQYFRDGLAGLLFDNGEVKVVPTPAGRNSRFYDNRRACAGNTNCVPICPIQAKYDPTVTLHKAFKTGRVHALFRHVARRLELDPVSGAVQGVRVISYDDPARRSPSGESVVRGRRYVLAANAIETPRLLLMSRLGEANRNIGRYLMDHPFYLRWGLASRPIFPYRGPLSTAGLDSLRDGQFRKERAAYRIEIGNDGWLLPMGGPAQTVLDFVDRTNISGIYGNDPRPTLPLYGEKLVAALNDHFTRQCRIGFEIEQLPLAGNRVMLSDSVDALGLPRPRIQYSHSYYEQAGFRSAASLAERIFKRLGVEDYSPDATEPRMTKDPVDPRMPANTTPLIMGAGHLMGTCRMGTDPSNSVVDCEQRSWECNNLFMVGSGVFPTCATANPTLTLAALAFWAADTISEDLKQPESSLRRPVSDCRITPP